MEILLIIIFIVGYTAIAFEHPLRLNKAASALLTGGLLWTLLILSVPDYHFINEELMHHLGEIASIVFFLLGAMTIVELIDGHNGFDVITRQLSTTNKSKLLIIVSFITFFLSALLDNLTTSIVMTSLCIKLISDRNNRLLFAGIIIISANAGGAWSPLGDVTTTMLWIGNQVTALNIIKTLFIPSVFVALVPTLILSLKMKGQQITTPNSEPSENAENGHKESKYILIMGVLLLLFVPVFKTLTHLPPFMGMLIALAIMWVYITILHQRAQQGLYKKLSVAAALQRIDSSSILFFLGILLAVSALQSAGILPLLATYLNDTLGNDYLIGIALGLLSALVDNVPLVAAAQGMYDLTTYPTDHPFWEFLALTTGTGGSCIIIGSAAGVAVMGIEQVDFIWYLRKITWLALIGFAAGIGVFLLQLGLM
ncbi:MAG: sodium:proton antiporter NhaD [Bacteroidota bacterium]|nr:sodium:proton antiporter NhaD [Bacteroidota bacterium]